MTCACGRPVEIKKHGLCKRCDGVQRYRRKKGIDVTDPTWKRKTEIKKAEKLQRRVSVKSPNLIAKSVAVEMRAIRQINRHAGVIQGFRDRKTQDQIGAELGISGQRVAQIGRIWGIKYGSFGRRPIKQRKLTATDRTERATARRMRAIAEFWSLCDKSGENGCWNWTGRTLIPKKKYPNNKVPRWGSGHIVGEQRSCYAYRVAYALCNGPIPKGMTVDHICFNPMCCNPAHLQLLTLSENAARKDPAKIAARRAQKAAA